MYHIQIKLCVKKNQVNVNLYKLNKNVVKFQQNLVQDNHVNGKIINVNLKDVM